MFPVIDDYGFPWRHVNKCRRHPEYNGDLVSRQNHIQNKIKCDQNYFLVDGKWALLKSKYYHLYRGVTSYFPILSCRRVQMTLINDWRLHVKNRNQINCDRFCCKLLEKNVFYVPDKITTYIEMPFVIDELKCFLFRVTYTKIRNTIARSLLFKTL